MQNDREVKVAVEPTNVSETTQPSDSQAWLEFVQSMAGCITDPTFERPDQGEYEQRSELFP